MKKRLNKSLIMMCAVLVLLSMFTLSAKVGGVVMPEQIASGDSTLVLNGAGIRTKLFKLYVGGLYLVEKTSNADEIINADAAMSVRLEIISGLITAEKMESATREGFQKSTKGNTAPIAQEIESFLDVFRETISLGDIFEFAYRPGEGVVIYKNGVEKNRIQGMSFKSSLFGIWLCDKPAQEKLKKAMLGGK